MYGPGVDIKDISYFRKKNGERKSTNDETVQYHG